MNEWLIGAPRAPPPRQALATRRNSVIRAVSNTRRRLSTSQNSESDEDWLADFIPPAPRSITVEIMYHYSHLIYLDSGTSQSNSINLVTPTRQPRRPINQPITSNPRLTDNRFNNQRVPLNPPPQPKPREPDDVAHAWSALDQYKKLEAKQKEKTSTATTTTLPSTSSTSSSTPKRNNEEKIFRRLKQHASPNAVTYFYSNDDKNENGRPNITVRTTPPNPQRFKRLVQHASPATTKTTFTPTPIPAIPSSNSRSSTTTTTTPNSNPNPNFNRNLNSNPNFNTNLNSTAKPKPSIPQKETPIRNEKQPAPNRIPLSQINAGNSPIHSSSVKKILFPYVSSYNQQTQPSTPHPPKLQPTPDAKHQSLYLSQAPPQPRLQPHSQTSTQPPTTSYLHTPLPLPPPPPSPPPSQISSQVDPDDVMTPNTARYPFIRLLFLASSNSSTVGKLIKLT